MMKTSCNLKASLHFVMIMNLTEKDWSELPAWYIETLMNFAFKDFEKKAFAIQHVLMCCQHVLYLLYSHIIKFMQSFQPHSTTIYGSNLGATEIMNTYCHILAGHSVDVKAHLCQIKGHVPTEKVEWIYIMDNKKQHVPFMLHLKHIWVHYKWPAVFINCP